METILTAYLGLLLAAVWCAAYMRHLRETAHAQQERLVPVLPYGAGIDVFPQLCTRYGMLPYALALSLLLFGLFTLPWQAAVSAWTGTYGLVMPLAYRFLTPPTGAVHYLHTIRKTMFRRLHRVQSRDEFRARLLTLALEHIR